MDTPEPEFTPEQNAQVASLYVALAQHTPADRKSALETVFPTAYLMHLTDAELGAEYLNVRKFLTRNNAVPCRFRAKLDAATRAKERRYVSAENRIKHIANARGITLPILTVEMQNADGVFKVVPSHEAVTA